MTDNHVTVTVTFDGFTATLTNNLSEGPTYTEASEALEDLYEKAQRSLGHGGL